MILIQCFYLVSDKLLLDLLLKCGLRLIQITCALYTELVFLAQQTYHQKVDTISIAVEACAKDLYKSNTTY